MTKSNDGFFGIALLMGLMCVIGGIMWDASLGMAWQDLNNSTTAGTTQHAATSAGQLFGSGFGLALVAIGVLLMVGSIIMLFTVGSRRMGGR